MGGPRATDVMIETARLLLRRWRPSDREPFARMCADPRVMEHFPRPATRDESNDLVDRAERSFAERGYGLWAVEERGGAAFIGFVGLFHRPLEDFATDFAPCDEIGWRLAFAAWGRGYATEAARAVRDHAFATLAMEEIVSFTVPGNVRSRRVMEKIGLRHEPARDFLHPNLPAGHPLQPHVFYRLRREWMD